MLKAILATDQMGSIGYKYDLPWPKNEFDLAWFHNNTLGCDVICGRKTWDGLHSDVKERFGTAYVVTRDYLHKTGAYQDIACDVETLKRDRVQAMRNSDKTTWVIGGKQIYDELIPLCQEIYITTIPGVYRADTFMDIDALRESLIPDKGYLMPDQSWVDIYKRNKES